jgi:hypothetical protein
MAQGDGKMIEMGLKHTKCTKCGYEAITSHPKEKVLPCRKCQGKLEIIAEEKVI